MNVQRPLEHNSFAWNAGGWFGSQLGGTVWMLFGGLSLLFADALSGLICLSGFAVVNGIGCYLWQRQERLEPYVGFQRLSFTLAVVCTSIGIVLNCRGVLSFRESILLIVIAPVLMSFLALQNWEVKRNQRERNDSDRSNQNL